MKILMVLFLVLFTITPGHAGVDNGDGIIQFTFTPVTTNADGTPFVDPANPTPGELLQYNFYCGPADGPYVLLDDSAPAVPVFPVNITPAVTVPLEVVECYATAIDASGNESTRSNLVQWWLPPDTVFPGAITDLGIQ